MRNVMKGLGILNIIVLASSLSLWADAPSADAGAKTYAAKCGSCHAKDGKGNPAMGKVFKIDAAKLDMTKKETIDKTDADLAKIIHDGVNKMPAYKEKLTDADIANVVAYMRSLATK